VADCVAKGRNRWAYGEASGRAKLRDEDIRFIRRAVSDGMTQARLARAYQVSGTVIYQIIHGKTWRHIA